MKKKTKGLIIVLLCVLLVVMLFSGYKLYSIVHEYRVAQRAYNKLSDQFVSDNSGAQVPKADDPEVQPQDTAQVIDPDVSPIQVDFDALLATSKNVVGWLYSPDTVINYPVAQADDNEYYLHRLYDGSYNPSGTLFLDYRCEHDFSGRNTIVYGHHMNDGSMLASIVDYSKPGYYEKHPSLYLNTPQGNYRIDVFSGFITASGSTAFTLDLHEDDAFTLYVNKMRGFSDFETEVEIGTDDKLVTFVTCTYEYTDARYVLLGKLVPIH